MKKPGSPGSPANCQLPTVNCLAAHLHERLEHVERKLVGVNDVAQVMKRRAAILHVIDGQVVLPQKLVCFVLGHGRFSYVSRGQQ